MLPQQVDTPGLEALYTGAMGSTESTAEEDPAARRRRLEHNLAREGRSICMECGDTFPTTSMVAKAVDFRTVTKPVKRLRSRTLGKLCEECLEQDRDWQRETRYI